MYEGSLNSENKPDGYGQLIQADGSVIIANFASGKAKGEGRYIFKDGSYFHGNF